MASSDQEQHIKNDQRIILGRKPLALRFGLTILALVMAVVILALAGQWVWSVLMLVILVLAIVALFYWMKKQ